jgi:phenylacetate-CoA ligase
MNRFLTRKLIFPLYRALKRDGLSDYLTEMHRVEMTDPEEIRGFQWNKMIRLLKHASAHVPYYRELFKKLGASPEDFKTEQDLQSLPVLRKEDIRRNLDALVSEVHPRSDIDRDSTGGSTAENLYFFVGKEVRPARRANNLRMNEWIDIDVGDRTAYLWGTPFDMSESKKLIKVLRGRLWNDLTLSAYRMDEDTVMSYLDKLRKFKPDLMVGYPSALTYFSDSMLKTGVKGIRPKAVLLSGETLYDHQREIIEEAFQARAYNHYGCREFGGMARECRLRNGLHIACERVLLEALPVSGTSEAGEATELVITDLDAFAMPFIRYAIEDMGTITWERCGCGLGLPRLETTIGRTFDVVRAPNGNALGGTFWTILLRKKKGIERWQVVQEKPDEITIALIPTDEFSEDTRGYILEKVAEACGEKMRVRFEPRTSLDTTPTGKHRFVISKIGPGGRGRDETQQGS